MKRLLGAPHRIGMQQFALYQPVVGRLVLTTPSRSRAEDIVLLASARYPLHVFDLVTADNWHPELIDNTCCLEWGVGDHVKMSAVEPAQIAQLQQLGPPSRDFRGEHEFLLACLYWSELLDYVCYRIYPDWHRVSFSREFLAPEQSDIFDQITRLRHQVRASLYLDRPYSDSNVRHIFTSLLPDYERIAQEFDQWHA